MIIKNREKFETNEKIKDLLIRFEEAHKNQNAFHLSVILTKLRQQGVTIIPGIKDEQVKVPSQSQSSNEIHCPVMEV